MPESVSCLQMYSSSVNSSSSENVSSMSMSDLVENSPDMCSEKDKLKPSDILLTCPVDYLTNLCIKYIAGHLLEIGIKNAESLIIKEQWDIIMAMLPLNLPLSSTLPNLDHNTYWQRMCNARWHVTDGNRYDWNFRRMYAEKHAAEYIESYVPYLSSKKSLNNVIAICKDLVTCLDIRTLQQNKIEAILEIAEDEQNKDDDDDDINAISPYSPPNHIDVGQIFLQFPNLSEIHLCISPRDCELTFDYRTYRFTLEDGEMLSKSIRMMANLKVLSLYGSCVSCELVRDLCSIFGDHSTLEKLDLSFNILTEKSGRYIAKLLMSPCPLKNLLLGNNSIGNEGANYLGAALAENSMLTKLDLRLNGIEDNGGAWLAECLGQNNVLKNLNLSGNNLGVVSGLAFAYCITTSKSIEVLNLSCNSLGQEAGKHLKEAMAHNTVITDFDVRLCDFNNKDEIEIMDFVTRNAKSRYFQ